ncbi:hypothetical protein ACTJK5_09670 [Agrobacterium sp. 22094]|uniref:hypothetical protein n=1 Tax=Agrobacterium sp. 22094 TaxID=3453872 RepID=UPI003F865AB5
MAHTIPTAVSALGDAFQAMLLDSERVTKISVTSTTEDVVHELKVGTTLVVLNVDSGSAGVLVCRLDDAFDDERAWLLQPGQHPLNVPGGIRTLRFRALADETESTVRIQEN